MSPHPSLPGRLAGPDLADAPDDGGWRVVASREVYGSDYLTVRVDSISDDTGPSSHDRAVVATSDAVAVLAVDDDGRILLVSQYRHPLRGRLIELPAGKLDVEGEARVDAARRELAEEADIEARTWRELFTLSSTPGFSDERLTIFRASGLSTVASDERYERQAEEAGMQQFWLTLDAAADAVRSGRISDAKTVAAIWAEVADRA